RRRGDRCCLVPGAKAGIETGKPGRTVAQGGAWRRGGRPIVPEPGARSEPAIAAAGEAARRAAETGESGKIPCEGPLLHRVEIGGQRRPGCVRRERHEIGVRPSARPRNLVRRSEPGARTDRDPGSRAVPPVIQRGGTRRPPTLLVEVSHAPWVENVSFKEQERRAQYAARHQAIFPALHPRPRPRFAHGSTDEEGKKIVTTPRVEPVPLAVPG